jgi:para-aminobenzoate synthetase component 1
MDRKQRKYAIDLNDDLKTKLLAWAGQYEEVVWMDSNGHEQAHNSFQALLAVDAFTVLQTDFKDAFQNLKEYQTATTDWLFGYLTYDLKNDMEQLVSENHDSLGFPDLFFFQPKKVFLFTNETVELHYLNMVADEVEKDWMEILGWQTSEVEAHSKEVVKVRLRTSKDSYFEKVYRMLAHIERGDIYEANFCQEFFSENTSIDPIRTFQHLNSISKPPFATFFKSGNQYALSASPERYLRKRGAEIVSQPIKGTARREANNDADLAMKEFLARDPKERSENIMITDLVRNDLSRFAIKGSVVVEELCAVYTFEQLHQMISTIRCLVNTAMNPVDILRETFPMGSMTGAPKISAMKIIEALEDTKRGLYSGAMGYFTPDGDFDFNVVIRSILYHAEKEYVSFSVGGAITAASIPENEYEECLLKAKAMREVLEN